MIKIAALRTRMRTLCLGLPNGMHASVMIQSGSGCVPYLADLGPTRKLGEPGLLDGIHTLIIWKRAPICYPKKNSPGRNNSTGLWFGVVKLIFGI